MCKVIVQLDDDLVKATTTPCVHINLITLQNTFQEKKISCSINQNNNYYYLFSKGLLYKLR